MTIDELEQAVAKMRALGVRRWGDIELDDAQLAAGPATEPDPSDDDNWPDAYASVPHLKKFTD